MNFLNIGKNLSTQSQHEREKESRQKEAEQFDLASTDGFPSFVKYAVFGVLAALNFRLFYIVVPGTWGLVISGTAVLFEYFAVYAWNNQKKSAGRHKDVLTWISYLFTGVSFIHASASFYELIGMGPSLGRPLQVYSHYVAFPLLFTMMMIAVCALYKTHWSAEAAKKQAETATQIAKDRADLLRRTAELNSKGELSRAELAHYEEEMKTEAAFMELLRKTVAMEQEKRIMLAKVQDPATRRRLAELLGRDLNEDGIPDVLQSPALQAEARQLMNGEDRGKLPN